MVWKIQSKEEKIQRSLGKLAGSVSTSYRQ